MSTRSKGPDNITVWLVTAMAFVLAGGAYGQMPPTCQVCAGVGGSPTTPAINCSNIFPSAAVTITTSLIPTPEGSVEPASLSISCTPTITIPGNQVTASGYCYDDQSNNPVGRAGTIDSVSPTPEVCSGVSGNVTTFTYSVTNYKYYLPQGQQNYTEGSWQAQEPVNVTTTSCNCPSCYASGSPPSVCAKCPTGVTAWQDCVPPQVCNTATYQCVSQCADGSSPGDSCGTCGAVQDDCTCNDSYGNACGECGSGTIGSNCQCSDTSGAGDPCGSCGALDCDGSCNDPCADGGDDGGDGGEGSGGGSSYCDTYPDDPDCNMDCWSDNDCDGGYCKRDGFCDWDLADPVIVDLDGGGFDLTSAQNGVKFDFFGTGNPIQLSWTAPASTNAWLVLDLNGDGRIDNGLEMFGNATRQPGKPATRLGFNALAFYDLPANGGNGDGVIDAQDRIFPRLRLWVDKNHNGISEPGELLTMEQAGIRSISLKYQSQKWTDAYGNRFRNRAKVVWAGHGQGQDHWAYDVVLMTAK